MISAVDNNKNGDLCYWFEDFLKISQRDDDYFHTQKHFRFIKILLRKDYQKNMEGVSKADQADFLNKSINFFRGEKRIQI